MMSPRYVGPRRVLAGEDRGGEPHREEVAAVVDARDEVELRERLRRDAPRAEHAGVGHEQVQAAVPLHRDVQPVRHGRLVHDVHGDRGRTSGPEPRREVRGIRLRERPVDVGEDDVAALGHEVRRDREPEALRRAGDERHPSREPATGGAAPAGDPGRDAPAVDLGLPGLDEPALGDPRAPAPRPGGGRPRRPGARRGRCGAPCRPRPRCRRRRTGRARARTTMIGLPCAATCSSRRVRRSAGTSSGPASSGTSTSIGQEPA